MDYDGSYCWCGWDSTDDRSHDDYVEAYNNASSERRAWPDHEPAPEWNIPEPTEEEMAAMEDLPYGPS